MNGTGNGVTSSSGSSAFTPTGKASSAAAGKSSGLPPPSSPSVSSLGNFSAEVLSKSSAGGAGANSSNAAKMATAEALAAQQLYELRLSELLAAGSGGLHLGVPPPTPEGFPALFAPFDGGFPLAAHSALLYANSLATAGASPLLGGARGSPSASPVPSSPLRVPTPNAGKQGEKKQVSASCPFRVGPLFRFCWFSEVNPERKFAHRRVLVLWWVGQKIQAQCIG